MSNIDLFNNKIYLIYHNYSPPFNVSRAASTDTADTAILFPLF